MDRRGFIDFNVSVERELSQACLNFAERRKGRYEATNTRLSPENSGKAASYAQAIRILDAVLMHQHVVDLHGRSLYDIRDLAVLEQVWELVKEEVKKMKKREYESQEYYDRNFGCMAGRPMTMPAEFKPSKDFLAYHRDHVFVGM